jgi:hypothetical protein
MRQMSLAQFLTMAPVLRDLDCETTMHHEKPKLPEYLRR